MKKISNYFKINERHTTIKTEFLGGFTTFLAMSYILFVNPDVLAAAGMDFGAVFTVTALAGAIGTLIMGLYANFPVALAPGMGMNAFFSFSVVIGLGIPWPTALAGIFCSGMLFVIISFSGLRELIINAIPLSLKYAVGTGIGFFIAFIGFKNAGIIVADEATFVTFTSFSDPETLNSTILAIIGLLITIVLYVKKVPGAIFLGMIVTAIIGIFMGEIAIPTQVISAPPSIAPTFGAMFGPLKDPSTYNITFLIVVITFLFVDFFDTAGTLIAVGTNAGLIDEEGKLKNSQRALLADSTATLVGAVLGTSSTTAFVESLTGVKSGARTGLASVFTAMFLLLALFFSPLLSVVTSAVTAPALIMVGALMVTSFGKIDWSDIAITIPSFTTVIIMTLAYSIADGLAAGFILYALIMVATNRAKEVHPIMYMLSILFVIYFII
ncbi:MAG: NCS2 family permease [Bacilli bacterium]